MDEELYAREWEFYEVYLDEDESTSLFPKIFKTRDEAIQYREYVYKKNREDRFYQIHGLQVTIYGRNADHMVDGVLVEGESV